MSSPAERKAVLRGVTPPDETQRERLLAFLKRSYGGDFTLEWIQDESIKGGFVLEAGSDVYDWSLAGRLRQLRESMCGIKSSAENVIPLIREAAENWTPRLIPEEIGHVVSVGDQIATVSGLEKAAYGEILLFPSGVKGMVQELCEDSLGCILFGGDEEVSEGSEVRRSGRVAGIPVGDACLGRVIDALGSPIDGRGEIPPEGYRPIEAAAPQIIDRQPVNRPLETGILAIDSMFPIGRGQRELIIGDRQTGKTALALDTILNQKGKDVICIYAAIGQKASSVAQVVQTLESHGALDYSVVVCASAGDSATLQYIAPYAACALGEYFMDKGRDVLIVYDDLSKHAIAYRALSLLLGRSPGREAYPRRVLSALPAPRTLGAALRGARRRQHDRPAHSGDPGRRRLCLYTYEYHIHHRRTDLPRERAVHLGSAPGGKRRPVRLPRGRRRADERHEKGRRLAAAGACAVPRDGGVHAVLQ